MRLIDLARHTSGQLRLVSPPRRRATSRPGFYEPPDPLAPGRPGQVIRAERMDAYLTPGLRLRGRVWRVLYRSTSATGEPTAVSGTVLIPPGKARVRPVIGYAVGTHGIGELLVSAGAAAEEQLECRLLRRDEPEVCAEPGVDLVTWSIGLRSCLDDRVPQLAPDVFEQFEIERTL